MADPAGSTAYAYNTMGQVTRETRIMNGVTYITRYTYDSRLNIETVTYPGGLVVTYQRDSTGRITGTTAGGQAITGATSYLPYGPVTGMILGNNILSISRDYDARYQLTQNTAGSIMDHGYTHDPSGNILTISGVTDVAPIGGTTNYSYQANHLTSATGHEAAQYTYDDNGNITSDGTRTFVYNQNNRLIRVEEGSTVLSEYASVEVGSHLELCNKRISSNHRCELSTKKWTRLKANC